MKLDEIIVEREQRTDELLGGIAKGAGKVLGGVAKGVGAVAGIGQGMKKAFQKGKQASIDVIGGTGQGADSKAAPAQDTGGDDSGASTAGGGNAAAGGGGGMAAAFNRGVNNPIGGGKAQPQQAQGGSAQTAQPQAQQAQGDAAPEEPKAEPGVVQDLQKRITALDRDSQRQVLQFLQKSASTPASKSEPAADNTAPPAPAGSQPASTPAATNEPAADQAGGKLSPDAFGKMATDLAGGAQKTADAQPQQTNQPKPAGGKGQDNFNPDTGAPTTQYGQQKQSNDALKAKLKSGQGLAKTSGGGFKQGMAKGNMRLGAGRGGVTMSHTPEGEPIVESTKKKQWILFRS